MNVLMLVAVVLAVMLVAVVLAVVFSVLWWGSGGTVELRPLLPARADLPMGACSPSQLSWAGSGKGKKGWQ